MKHFPDVSDAAEFLERRQLASRLGRLHVSFVSPTEGGGGEGGGGEVAANVQWSPPRIYKLPYLDNDSQSHRITLFTDQENSQSGLKEPN